MPASDPATRAMRRIDAEQAADDELVSATADGDRAAFAVLFQRTQGAVYRFALHMTGSPEAADDITQDVFLVVMRDAGRYDKRRATVTAWLCGIARNYARRRRASDALFAAMDEQTEAQCESPSSVDPVIDLVRQQRVEAVRRAVLRLPFKYREVVVLCDLQEMNYVDAAGALGCAVGTVRSRLHRGRVLLAEKLSAIEGRGAPVSARGSNCLA
jgi:RNA polymerase sigma-70 factor (ECF subfamily)